MIVLMQLLYRLLTLLVIFFFFQAEDGIRDGHVTGVQTCALPISELFMDGKAFNGNKSAATLIPPAFGLAGVNLHTWTGWGSVTHWNAFVANLEMHGKGTFFDPRLADSTRFPIAAQNGFDNVRSEVDLITPKLADLHFYQLALDAPAPPAKQL